MRPRRSTDAEPDIDRLRRLSLVLATERSRADSARIGLGFATLATGLVLTPFGVVSYAARPSAGAMMVTGTGTLATLEGTLLVAGWPTSPFEELDDLVQHERGLQRSPSAIVESVESAWSVKVDNAMKRRRLEAAFGFVLGIPFVAIGVVTLLLPTPEAISTSEKNAIGGSLTVFGAVETTVASWTLFTKSRVEEAFQLYSIMRNAQPAVRLRGASFARTDGGGTGVLTFDF